MSLKSHDSSVVIIGNIAGECNKINDSFAKSTVAIESNWKDGDEWKTSVSYIGIKATSEYRVSDLMDLSKGESVYIQGELDQETWENDSGQKNSQIYVEAYTIIPIPDDSENYGDDDVLDDVDVDEPNDDIPF